MAIDFDTLTSMLIGIVVDHVFVDSHTCRCGYKATDVKDWRWHVAGNQAEAVLTALEG